METREKAIREIKRAATDWAEANCARDPERMMLMFRASTSFRFGENGAIFSSFQAYKDFVERFYSQTTDMVLAWKQLDVLPLTDDVAVLIGIFEYRAAQRSGEVFEGCNALTGVFTKEGGDWRLIHGHESSQPR